MTRGAGRPDRSDDFVFALDTPPEYILVDLPVEISPYFRRACPPIDSPHRYVPDLPDPMWKSNHTRRTNDAFARFPLVAHSVA